MAEILVKTGTRHRDQLSSLFMVDWTAGDILGIRPDGGYSKYASDKNIMLKTTAIIRVGGDIPKDFNRINVMKNVDGKSVLAYRSQKIINLEKWLTDQQLKDVFNHDMMVAPILLKNLYSDVIEDRSTRSCTINPYDRGFSITSGTYGVGTGQSGSGGYETIQAFEADIGTQDGNLIANIVVADDETDPLVCDGYTQAGHYVYFTVNSSVRSATGIWDDTKYNLQVAGDTSIVTHRNLVVFTGFQISVDPDANDESGWLAGYDSNGDGGDVVFDKCIVKSLDTDGTYASNGFRNHGRQCNLTVTNSIVYGFLNNANGVAVYNGDANAVTDVTNCTISNNYYGCREASGTLNIYNSAVFNNVDDFVDTPTVILYCASDDGDDTGANAVDISPGGTEATDWAAAFTDYANGDFSVKDASSVLYNAGTDLSGSGVIDDIIGTARPQATTYDIGAFELVAAAGGLSIPVAMRAVMY